MPKLISQIQQNKEGEEIDINQKRKGLRINDIIVPLSLGVILIILTIFVFIPMIQSAIGFRDELKEVKSKQEKMIKLRDSLAEIDESILQIDLINARSVIPDNLKVSSFIYYVDELAKSLNLDSKTLSAGDIQLSVGDEKEKQQYFGVNGPLAYSGTNEAVLKFLDSLYSASPYIISADNIILEESSLEDNWKVSLNITGYYVPTKSYNIDLYMPFSVYSKQQAIVDIFDEKATKLKN